MSHSLTAHSRKKWRAAGYYVELTEHVSRVPQAPGTKGPPQVRRHDLHGFADLVALDDAGKIYIQTTSWGNVSARLKKIRTETTGVGQFAVPIASIVRRLLLHGDRVLVEGWKLDTKTHRWISRETWMTEEML